MNEGPPIRSLTTFEDLDPTERELTIGKLIVEIHDWLATADSPATPIWEFSSARAYVADIATVTRRLGLSVDLRLDALLVLRLAERTVAKAVRHAQAIGELGSTHTNNGQQRLPSPIPYIGAGNTAHTIYQMVDGITDIQFASVLAQARSEGKLARNHLVRKLDQVRTGKRADSRPDLVSQARDVAEQLRRVTVRLKKLQDDDRLGRNKTEVAARLRYYLAEAETVCVGLRKTLDEE